MSPPEDFVLLTVETVDFQIRTTTSSTLDLSSRLTHPLQRIAKGRRNVPTFITQYDAVVAVRIEKNSASDFFLHIHETLCQREATRLIRNFKYMQTVTH